MLQMHEHKVTKTKFPSVFGSISVETLFPFAPISFVTLSVDTFGETTP